MSADFKNMNKLWAKLIKYQNNATNNLIHISSLRKNVTFKKTSLGYENRDKVKNELKKMGKSLMRSELVLFAPITVVNAFCSK